MGVHSTPELITSKIYSFEVYDSQSYYDRKEEIVLQGSNAQDKTIISQTGRDVFFKEKSIFGRGEDHEVKLNDPFISILHCKIEWDNWFTKKRLWIRQYSLLLRNKDLPTSIWRNIFEFIKEPQYIKLIDLMSTNGTMVALKPGKNNKLERRQKYRLGESLDMSIKQQEVLELEETESFEKVDKKLEENSQAITYTDFSLAEEGNNGNNRKYNFLSIKLSLVGQKNMNSRYLFASNKEESRWLIGSSLEADIWVKHDKLDDYQCEIVQKNGNWYIVEWQHNMKKKRTYLRLNSNNKEYLIKENTEFLVGKTAFSLTFPNMKQSQEWQNPSQGSMNSICDGTSYGVKN